MASNKMCSVCQCELNALGFCPKFLTHSNKKRALSDELIDPCWVCKKRWQRKDTDKYYYFNGTTVCQGHDGAKEFYQGALRLGDEAIKSL